MRLFLTLSLLAASTGAAMAAPVIDFSEDPSANLLKLTAAQDKAILGAIFPAFVTDYAACPTTGNKKVEVIINDVQAANGHFTRRDATDTVVVFKSVDCNGGHAGEHSNVALFQDGKLVAYSQEFASSLLYKTIDADGDGLDDIISTDSYSNMGYTSTGAQTLTFKGNRIAALDYVQGQVHYDDCGLDGKTEGDFDAVFFANPRDARLVTQKNYRKACGTTHDAYKFYSNGKLNKDL